MGKSIMQLLGNTNICNIKNEVDTFNKEVIVALTKMFDDCGFEKITINLDTFSMIITKSKGSKQQNDSKQKV